MRALALALFVVGCSHAAPSGLPSTSSAECAHCHADQGDDFASSRHAHATESPVLQAMLPRVATSWGEAARDRCVGCHAPPHGDDQAIGCISCHGAVGDRGARDGRLVIDANGPILGTYTSPGAPHRMRTSGLLVASELCASCHEVTGPDLFVEHTGTEHALAMQTTNAPECIGCHMAAIDGDRHDHRFVGLDPAWGGSDAERAAATDASRDLLASALELRITASAIELENVGAGHAVPTGVAFLRDLWVDADVTHADGTTEHLARVITLGDRSMRGSEPVALPTDADRVEENRLQPFEIRRFTLPSDVIATTATLRARAIRDDALEALAIDPHEVPTIVVATVSR